MTIFRTLLIIAFVGVAIYTVFTITDYGLGIVPAAIDALQSMTWLGQFTLDFATYLALTAGWVMWRHRFSPTGILLGVLALTGGILFLAPYLLVLSFREKGDVRRLLLGAHAEIA